MIADGHSIVICVHNALDDVQACINSLQRSSQPFLEIICVDDSSDEPTKNYLEHARAQFDIHIARLSARSGYTKAANLGVRLARGSVVTLLNSDTVVPAKWSQKVMSAFTLHPKIGLLGPLSNAASYQSVPSIVGTGTQTAINRLPLGVSVEDMDRFCEKVSAGLVPPYVPLVHGFCMSMSRACLEEVGEFDEVAFPLGYGEENDFCIRVADAGFALCILMSSFVFHAKSKSYAPDERVKLMKLGWDALVAKHGKRRFSRSIKIMEEQPVLAEMRRAVDAGFNWKDETSAVASGADGAQISQASKANAASFDVRCVAFYLPQFHTIPFNDKTWGEGFTEWRNVVRARPRFPGHVQPKLPGKLGLYDLRRTEVMQEQADLAAQYGVYGVCMYYYRIAGRRLLHRPPEALLLDSSIKLRFCYCWANESWTRAWDGKSSEELLKQEYDDATFWGIVNDVVSAADDDRYIAMNGRPVFIIYQVAEIPDAERWVSRLRQELNRLSGREFYIGSNFSVNFKNSMLSFIDFVVQFPPHRIPRHGRRITVPPAEVKPFEPTRGDYYESYDAVITASLAAADFVERQFLGVCPDWDNTPRRATNAHTIIGSTPAKFRDWVRQAADLTRQRYDAGLIPEKVLFVNAWNEWAEGAVLEPSEQHGIAYLAALREGLLTDRHPVESVHVLPQKL